MIRMLAPLALAAATLAAAGPAGAAPLADETAQATPKLVAVVGPGDSIALRTASGSPARVVKAGTYVVVVRDRADDHNFHLRGPGVNKATSVAGTGTVSWRVKLAPGKTYRFVCDPHSDDMRGSLRVR